MNVKSCFISTIANKNVWCGLVSSYELSICIRVVKWMYRCASENLYIFVKEYVDSYFFKKYDSDKLAFSFKLY